MVGAMKVMKEQAKVGEQVWSDESVNKVLEIGKSTAKKALKTFKGLGSLMVDQLLTSQ
jgi:5,10-methenyltetrahydromethanopterin hydrogenase